MALNLELYFTKDGESLASYGCIDESINTIIKTVVEDFVGTTSTDEMEEAVDAMSVDRCETATVKDTWEDLHEQGIVEQMANEGSWIARVDDNAAKTVFGEDENDLWSIEIDLDSEFVRFYNHGEFAGSFDFVELDDMSSKDVRDKCEEIATNGATITKLTMSDCSSVKSSMRQQRTVLEKLFKCIDEGREHTRLLEGISEEQLLFAEQYCRDMINAADTLSKIAENAEKILKPIEDAKKKAEAAKRKAKQDLETDAEGEEKPKKRKKRSPRKKKAAPVKIAQTETADDIAEVVEEVAEDGED